jgi:hypothetical protein
LPPTLEAMVSDLELIKDLGMNLVRKHVCHPRGFVRVLSYSSLTAPHRSRLSQTSSTRPAIGWVLWLCKTCPRCACTQSAGPLMTSRLSGRGSWT